jgi:hypothetical protein
MKYTKNSSYIFQAVDFFMPKEMITSVNSYDEIRTFYIARATIILTLSIVFSNLTHLIFSNSTLFFNPQNLISISILITLTILIFAFKNAKKIARSIICLVWIICIILSLSTFILNSENAVSGKWFPLLVAIPAFLKLKGHLTLILLIATFSVLVVFAKQNPIAIFLIQRNPALDFAEYVYLIFSTYYISRCIADCNHHLQSLINELSRLQMEREVRSISDSTLRSLRELASNVNIEFSEPLSKLKNNLALISQSSKNGTITKQEIGDFEKSFDSQIEQMTKLTLRMNNFAHAQQNQLQFETISLSKLTEEVKQRLKNSPTDEEVKCKFTIPDHVVIVNCNKSKIADAIMLLISFFINKSEGNIENQLTCTFTTRAENLVIEIANSISSNHSTARENDFNFTLNLVDSIAKLHKGKFTKTNKSDKVIFHVEMPIIQLGGTNE